MTAGLRLAGHLFPRLLAQSAYNTRLRQIAPLMEAALRWFADATPATAELLRLMDASPFPAQAAQRAHLIRVIFLAAVPPRTPDRTVLAEVTRGPAVTVGSGQARTIPVGCDWTSRRGHAQVTVAVSRRDGVGETPRPRGQAHARPR